MLRRLGWWLNPPTKVDVEQAAVDGDIDALRAIVRHEPSLARVSVQGTAWGPLVFAAVHDDVELLDACREADRLAYGSALELPKLGVLRRHPLLMHRHVGAIPLSYIGVAKLAEAERVYARLMRDATTRERTLCLPLAVVLRDEAWHSELVARGARADTIEYAGYHLAMLDPTPAQLAQILATGGEVDPMVSTAPPGFEEGDFDVLRLSEARRAGRDYWVPAFQGR